MKFPLKICTCVLGFMAAVSTAQAAVQVSVYGGANTAFNSDLTYSNNGSPVTNNVHWVGDSFEDPPYYGLRVIYWFDNIKYKNWGLGLDYTHDKVVADPLPPGYVHLEFTDGLNLVTADLFYHFLNQSRFTPYAALGAGLSIPHVEEHTVDPLFPLSTREYEVTGVALAALAGVDLRVWRGLSIFAEYKLNYSQVDDATLNEGQSLSTDLWVNNYILGISYLFG